MYASTRLCALGMSRPLRWANLVVNLLVLGTLGMCLGSRPEVQGSGRLPRVDAARLRLSGGVLERAWGRLGRASVSLAENQRLRGGGLLVVGTPRELCMCVCAEMRGRVSMCCGDCAHVPVPAVRVRNGMMITILKVPAANVLVCAHYFL